ncbi:MAG: hypothetical protein H8E76_01885 [Helicobacteraceae bacterium]|nr:hypothetical protein [Candidatus Sulfurimonas ponti]
MKAVLVKIIHLAFFLSVSLHAELQIIKKQNTDSNTTLLVIAGIHGNEPGSYFAGSILATHYTIKSKNLWIVPNLNKDSIRDNERGINGDMNRKFSIIKKNDKDKDTVEDIKKLILSKNVSLVLNLHDGHGFYREDFQGNIFNPNAWGQTCVIDQCKLKEDQPFGNLNEIASLVKINVNKRLLQEHHAFNVRNTKTKYEDEQMQLSLTYFTVTNNKPAFAIESSKNLSSLSQKVYYQLLAIEEFMKIMDISFNKSFALTEESIKKIIHEYGILEINKNISLNLSHIKKSLSYIPINSSGNEFNFSHPLGHIKNIKGTRVVYIGNKRITALKPQYFNISNECPKNIEINIDGKRNIVDSAKEFYVNDDFNIIRKDNLRVNVIGFTAKGVSNESGITIHRDSINQKFSLDIHQKMYRVEFYKDNKFCSMSVVHFK